MDESCSNTLQGLTLGVFLCRISMQLSKGEVLGGIANTDAPPPPTKGGEGRTIKTRQLYKMPVLCSLQGAAGGVSLNFLLTRPALPLADATAQNPAFCKSAPSDAEGGRGSVNCLNPAACAPLSSLRGRARRAHPSTVNNCFACTLGNCLNRARPRAKTRREGARGEVGDLTGTHQPSPDAPEATRRRSVRAGGRSVDPRSRTFFKKGIDKPCGVCYTISASVARILLVHRALDRPRPPQMAI